MKSSIRRHFVKPVVTLMLGALVMLSVPAEAVASQDVWCGCLKTSTTECSCSKGFSISPWATHTYKAICDVNDDGKLDPVDPAYTFAAALEGKNSSTTCTSWREMYLETSPQITDVMGLTQQCTNWKTGSSDNLTVKVTCGYTN